MRWSSAPLARSTSESSEDNSERGEGCRDEMRDRPDRETGGGRWDRDVVSADVTPSANARESDELSAERRAVVVAVAVGGEGANAMQCAAAVWKRSTASRRMVVCCQSDGGWETENSLTRPSQPAVASSCLSSFHPTQLMPRCRLAVEEGEASESSMDSCTGCSGVRVVEEAECALCAMYSGCS